MSNRIVSFKKWTSKQAKMNLPTRTQSSHKSMAGKTVIIGGSKQYKGAPLLSALAATRMGSGYTYLISNQTYKTALMQNPDIIFLNQTLKKNILNIKPSVIVFGPGLPIQSNYKNLLKFLIFKTNIPLVIDASGLVLLKSLKTPLPRKNIVLTPHLGEIAKLLSVSVNQIKSDLENSVLKANKKFNCLILLKGATTFIFDGHNGYKITSGTPALAKAGTGDVLAGMIGALIAQNKTELISACLGAFLHGLASQDWIKNKHDPISLRPLDLIEQLPKTIYKLRSTKLEPSKR